jgi:hypothetical protein
VIGQHGVMRYADAPLLADAADHSATTPAMVSALAPPEAAPASVTD